MPQKGIANELCDETMLIPSKLQMNSLRIKTSIKNLHSWSSRRGTVVNESD